MKAVHACFLDNWTLEYFYTRYIYIFIIMFEAPVTEIHYFHRPFVNNAHLSNINMETKNQKEIISFNP